MVRLLVLGLLQFKPLSGYEIQQILQVSQIDVWAGILPGSIYHALKKLAKEGLISLDNLEKTGNRTKAIYKITTAGRIEFKKLLRESLREKSVVLPSMLYMGLSFIRELPLEERLETLIEQKKELEKNFTVLKLGLKTKEQYGQLDEVTKLQFENLFAHYELQINFLNKLIEILPNQKNLPTDKIDEYFKATLDN